LPSNRKTRPVTITASSPLDEAAAVVKRGGIIVYPTETFYALGADPFNPQAIKRLYLLKGRPASMPISVIVGDAAMLGRITPEVTPLARSLMERFWPGPLTIIFDALEKLPTELTAGTGTIAARVSSDQVCRRLLSALDAPITATSANPSGMPPPVDASTAVEYFNGDIDLLIDGGRLKGTAGSTIVDCRGAAPVIVRTGEFSAADIMRVSQDR